MTMKKLTKNALLNLLNKAIPQPDQITHVDESEKETVAFNWRGLHFNVTTMLDVTESRLKANTCHSLLMQALLRETHTAH